MKPTQVDWVSDPAQPVFKDIRSTRSTVAQEKAELLLTLGGLINTIPPHIRVGGSVDDVREWRHARTAAAKIAGNARASVSEITSAISNMRRVFKA